MPTRPTKQEINKQLLEDAASKDGVIEPLEIRDVVTGMTHPRKVAHKIWGALDEGNINDRASSEIFISRVKRTDLQVGSFPFEDEANVIGQMPIPSESISPDNRRCGSFYDDQESKGIIIDTLNMESDMLRAIRAMQPPTENKLPPSYVQVGANGFTY
jgi:hypothetical protein